MFTFSLPILKSIKSFKFFVDFLVAGPSSGLVRHEGEAAYPSEDYTGMVRVQ
jgi:hypothetical protein